MGTGAGEPEPRTCRCNFFERLKKTNVEHGVKEQQFVEKRLNVGDIRL